MYVEYASVILYFARYNCNTSVQCECCFAFTQTKGKQNVIKLFLYSSDMNFKIKRKVKYGNLNEKDVFRDTFQKHLKN